MTRQLGEPKSLKWEYPAEKSRGKGKVRGPSELFFPVALGYPHSMELRGIAARIARLNALALGLGKEHSQVAAANDPLLYRERMDYLQAIRDFLAAVESARIVLVAVRKRIGGVK